MELRLLSHAALWIDSGDTRLLFDPWLQGTCYDGAWALVPDQPGLIAGLDRPDVVAFSHAHPDHFHLPSLLALRDRFGPGLPLVVPQQAVDIMAGVLRRLGFTDVREVALDRTHQLGPSLSVSFHACRADDSAQIIRAGGRVIVNANDCRLEGWVLAHMRRLAPSPDFYIGQFSFADGYPFCFDDLGPDELAAAVRAPLDQFRQQAAAFAPRWAIPAASFVRFATHDNHALNRLALTLDDVARDGGPAVTVLYPGDGWSDARGFLHEPAHRAAYDDACRAARAPASVWPDDQVPPADAVKAAANARLHDMCAVLPGWLRRRIGVIGFHMPDLDLAVVVHWAAGQWTWQQGEPDVPHYRLSAWHFRRVCEADWGWTTMHIGARFRARRWRQSHALSMFMPVSSLYAMRYFHQPWRHYLTPRVLQVLWARRFEIGDLAWRTARGAAWSDAPAPRL